MRHLFLLTAALAGCAVAEDGLAGWLRYAPLPEARARCHRDALPDAVSVLGATEGGPLSSAGKELKDGLQGIFGKTVDVTSEGCSGTEEPSIVVATLAEYVSACGELAETPGLVDDGFFLSTKGGNVLILGSNERGALYGTFEYLSRLAQGNFKQTAAVSNPDAPIRWANQWDNMDYTTSIHGSVERGFAGYSIFFKDNKIRDDLSRVEQYGRLLASVGINAIVINNVNANPITINAENLAGVGRIADLFRPYGVQVGLSLNFASPDTLGGLGTFDPFDERVIQWWTDKIDEIYSVVPDLSGFLVKANSEGQPGPITYNRTLADGANMFAKATKPHGGVIMFRAFVYDHHLDFRDWYNDRANAAVEFFKHLDGKFDDNVVVQIKYGPIDFQVREPPSTLFANMRDTPMAVELQITQEYLGQQNHLFYLTPLWKEILDFDLRIDDKPSLVRDVVSGKRLGHRLGGYAGVTNVGLDQNWLGSHLAMSNLYSFGRLAWDPTADSVEILEDWTRLTFGLDRLVIDTITEMSMLSWPMYENYTGNLGVQTLTDILYTHYGPNPASQDNNGWGQWTRVVSYPLVLYYYTKLCQESREFVLRVDSTWTPCGITTRE
jgi:alpha-glucuronidase